MPAQLLDRAARDAAPVLRPESDLPADLTIDEDAWHPECLVLTRRVSVSARAALGELHRSDPHAARRIEEAAAEMPEIGQNFLGFQLVQELGHGAFGRVFLARQMGLAGRPVALKVSADLCGESQRLAQLQHTNIMPIYSEHRAGSLHAVCMPYYGGTTLADLYKTLRAAPSLPTSGKHFVSTLCNRQSTLRHGEPSVASAKSLGAVAKDSGLRPRPDLPAGGGAAAALAKFERMSYPDAVLWIAARVADGLAHAHERGIIHRDLKPANVLLGDDGQPLLLDFNLAEDVKLRGSAAAAQVGGTLPYMAPEQLAAYRDGTGVVDARGDVYALGLMLYHLLTGRHAFPVRKGAARLVLPQMLADRAGPPPLLRTYNRAVTPTVEAIVRRCLEPDPAKRYQSARDLAEDIERHRADLPLKHTPEPSTAERLAKWARRHPRLTSPAALGCLAAAVVLAAVSAGVALSLAREEERVREQVRTRHEAALVKYSQFEREYDAARDLLASDDPQLLDRGLGEGEKALAEYGVLEHGDWFDRPEVKELTEDERARLQAHAGELAFLLARAAHFIPGERNDPEKALRLNKAAEANLGADAAPAVAQQRADLKRQGPDDAELERLRAQLRQAAAVNPQLRFLLAAEHVARGRYREALPALDQAVADDPKDANAWLLKGRCHQMLEQDAEAVAAFGTTIALRPNYARAYLARAEALFARGRNLDQARHDLDQALRLQPDLVEALVTRGQVFVTQGKAKEALADLDRALATGKAPARAWFVRAHARTLIGDAKGAAEDTGRGMETEPADALSWVARGFARAATDPEGALADFRKAEELYPRCESALHNQAVVYGAMLKKPDEAVAVLDRLLQHHPDHARAMLYRAVLLARLGRTPEAIAQARAGLKVSASAENQYRAACVFALASKEDPSLRRESLKLLASALLGGYGRRQLDADHDLDPIRAAEEFKQFAAFVRLTQDFTGAK
jgi:serine/threonine protein kinase/tetratricopeptide (TPR) repeat protein